VGCTYILAQYIRHVVSELSAIAEIVRRPWQAIFPQVSCCCCCCCAVCFFVVLTKNSIYAGIVNNNGSLPTQRADGIPVYLSTGQYHVRLFWMGAWRRIPVDDTRAWNDQLYVG
jgi:hypothetical protein